MSWHAVAKAEDVGEGQVIGVVAAERMIAVYRIEGTFYATSNVCTHAFALMSDGYIDGDCIECPIHGALFHIPTGEARTAPATVELETFPVKVEGDDLMVEVPT